MQPKAESDKKHYVNLIPNSRHSSCLVDSGNLSTANVGTGSGRGTRAQGMVIYSLWCCGDPDLCFASAIKSPMLHVL